MFSQVPILAFVISLVAGVFIVFAVWILANLGCIIRNIAEAVKQDKEIKP